MIKKRFVIFILLSFFLMLVGCSKELENSNTKNPFEEEIRNKEIALSYFKIFDIIDEESYHKVKSEIYSNLNGELQKELFGFTDFNSKIGIPVKKSLKNITVQRNNSKEFIYKIEHVFFYPKKNVDTIFFITVKNKKIINIEKIQ